MQSISAVIVSRNDHPLDLRTKLSILNHINTFDEVVYVDFNSPDKPLHQTTDFINSFGGTGKLKCITVDRSVIGDDAFIEVLARNIGIRRASSEFIVSTNIDIVARRPGKLAKDTMYTVRRRNVPEMNFAPIEILDEYKDSFEQMPMAYDFEKKCGIWDPGDDWSLVVGCGDFQIAHKDVWEKIRGFEERMTGRAYADSNVMKKAARSGFKIDILDLNVYHLDHPPRGTDTKENLNDQGYWVQRFLSTENLASWGDSLFHFDEVII